MPYVTVTWVWSGFSRRVPGQGRCSACSVHFMMGAPETTTLLPFFSWANKTGRGTTGVAFLSQCC